MTSGGAFAVRVCGSVKSEGPGMPRYLVEHTFPQTLVWASSPDATGLIEGVLSRATQTGVTWLHSYISVDQRRMYWICDAPTPAAVRETARQNDWPIDRITEVRVLDPYRWPGPLPAQSD